jgi:hypothetical protein
MYALLVLNKHKEALVAKCKEPTLNMLHASTLVIDLETQQEFLKDRFGFLHAPEYTADELATLIKKHQAAPRLSPRFRA